MLDISDEQLAIVRKIDFHVRQFPENESGSERLLTTIYDRMEPFKKILDTTTKIQMDYLCQNYSGFFRLSKLLELMAEGIATGTIKAPRDLAGAHSSALKL